MNGDQKASPLMQNSPPTPETTQPKRAKQVPMQNDEPSTRNVSDSRTDSFKTAHENISSESEALAVDSPSMRASRKRWLQDSGITMPKNIGLGLGLETD